MCQYQPLVLDTFHKKKPLGFKIFPYLHFGRCNLRKILQYTIINYCLPACVVYIEGPGLGAPDAPYRTCKDFLLTFNDSPQEGLQQGFSGSIVTRSIFFWNSSRTQSMILIIRCGGFASFLTVAISFGLIVCIWD